MGSDDLFRKRKARQAKDLKRSQEKRAPYDKVLIVCEGEKTEPIYFRELRDFYRLNTANIEVSGDCGSAPVSVVNKAKELYRKEQRNISFDRVYCVFDKDTHDSYEEALLAIKTAKPVRTFFAVNSVPCFEFWLLLHFVYTTQPFYGTVGAKSAADQVQDELKKYIINYAKGDHEIFEKLVNQLPQAIQYSKKVLQVAKESRTDNPSTLIHELVEYLQSLA